MNDEMIKECFLLTAFVVSTVQSSRRHEHQKTLLLALGTSKSTACYLEL